MSNYSKATNFTSKDSLPTGNASKIVKGAEIDTELTAVSSAISSKADINSPTFTGTPAAPTATSGSNTTQLANTAFVKGEITALNLGNMSTQNKNAVDITGGTISGLSTPLPVASGGTSSASLAANNVLLGNGTSALQAVAPGNSRNLLTSNGTTWVSQVPSYTGHNAQVFTSNGTFTVPTGVTGIKVTVVGGGGGGNNTSLGTATSGGNSTVASGTQSISTITGNGGVGAYHQSGGSGSGGSGGDLIIGGGNGEGFGEQPGASHLSTGRGVRGYGNGGQGYQGGEDPSYGSGGAGGTAIKWLTGLTPGNTLAVTIGAAGGSGSLAGTAGVVIFEW
jgi:hypothetical protein